MVSVERIQERGAVDCGLSQDADASSLAVAVWEGSINAER